MDFMEEITSLSNKKVKRLVQLQQKAKVRRQEQSFVIEGIRIVADAPADRIRQIVITKDLLQKLESSGGSFCASAAGQRTGRILLQKVSSLRTLIVPSGIFEKISDTASPQGVMAEVAMRQYDEQQLLRLPDRADSVTGAQKAASAESGNVRQRQQEEPVRQPLLLITEDVQDPGNLGTMIRTAEAAGVTGMIFSRGTVDVYQPKTVRATMSSVFRMPMIRTEDLEQTIRHVRAAGIQVLAAHLEGSRYYDEVDLKRPSAFLIGNEGNGLKPETAALADEKILIPMCGTIESLNAAMSAGILVYEAYRQRRHAQSQLLKR